MTKRDLIDALFNYPEDAHVVVAVLRLDRHASLGEVGRDSRREIHDVWCDRFGAVNVIATHPAGEVDPALRKENGLLLEDNC